MYIFFTNCMKKIKNKKNVHACNLNHPQVPKIITFEIKNSRVNKNFIGVDRNFYERNLQINNLFQVYHKTFIKEIQ